jgi:Uma2 family endonuclease
MVMTTVKAPALPLWRMTRVRYERLVDAGIFGPDDRVELLDGLLVAREPQGGPHATAVGLVAAALDKAFGRGFHIRQEKPIALDKRSEPEPDLAVVPGGLRDYVFAHPSRPVLVVEVADSSLALDRLRKGGLYARAGIIEYWIVNLIDEVLEVYREPVAGPMRARLTRYRSVRLLRPGASVTPLAAPRARVRVSALLP